MTIHELGHAFETLGGLSLPTFWLSEIFANLALQAFIATTRPESLSTLEDFEAHYTGGDQPMGPLNYVWYQYRWQRLAARMFDAEGENGAVRLWNHFHATDHRGTSDLTAAALAPILKSEVSATLGRAIQA